jgi:hypothetical protein
MANDVRLRFHDGQAYIEAGPSDPYPVRVVSNPEDGELDFRTYQVAVSEATATLIIGANQKRRTVLLTNKTGTQICYFSTDATVSATNGGYIAAAAGSSVTLSTTKAVWGLSVTAAQTLAVTEEFYP